MFSGLTPGPSPEWRGEKNSNITISTHSLAATASSKASTKFSKMHIKKRDPEKGPTK